jgi:hypothetical protein
VFNVYIDLGHAFDIASGDNQMPALQAHIRDGLDQIKASVFSYLQ